MKLISSKKANIDPAKINKNGTVSLYLTIVDPGSDDTPSFLSVVNQIPIGPPFTGVYDPASLDPTQVIVSDGNSVTVSNFPRQGMTKGQIAAAVLMPILVILGCIAGYIFWTRRREAVKRREYRENLDQRMSIAPGADWAPISAAGASAAIRHSMAMGNGDRNTRASSFFGRPWSESIYEGEEMRQTRRGNSTYETDGQIRHSTISFADSTTQPLNLNRPAVPPLPAAYKKPTVEITSPDQTNLSPTQREGAFVLDDDSIRDRLSGGSGGNGRASVMDLGADSLPALASQFYQFPSIT